ncbi:hypothetical protein K4S07_04330 [Staphylococcus epidermidis]|uniref:hypothetical protein n=2 Tax=Staphylococcus epidermidis TaxID=1282 RepID=UPI00026C1F99|nr:hypothetical protein [Staphylococcus epidermidis]EJD95507.1 hypothetical protein HMPREF9987_03027 [Staphylococcus epidermidis NIHLM049]MCG1064200.1 hypothetical protein [Staphylococcus epidermidis]MCG1246778.1 hypothetical protein [Staphylococcus epidermidis]MCG1267181.1 hypothetical protein [Staphylococcus epidermidis]MCG1370006.1 hypothetical protein [Staphylococcus epidermidis]
MKATRVFNVVVFLQFSTYLLFGMNIQLLFDKKESDYLFFIIPLFFTYIFDNSYTVLIDFCKPTEKLKKVESNNIRFINIIMLLAIIIYAYIYKNKKIRWFKDLVDSANENWCLSIILIIIMSLLISYIWSKYFIKSDYIEKLKEEDFDILGIENVINWLTKSNIKSKDISEGTNVEIEKIELLLKDEKNIDDFSYGEVKSILAYVKYVRESK